MRNYYFILMILFYATGCTKYSPAEDIISIIDKTEDKLYQTKSLEEISDMQFNMLDSITGCLDINHNSYRFVEGNEEYNIVMKRLDRYNIVYCNALSRFNPELNINKGDQDKVVHVLALMKRMEHQALTAPKGFNPERKTYNSVINNEEKLNMQSIVSTSHKKKIERDFDGIILGQSTKQDVINHLTQTGSQYEWDEEGNYIICKENISNEGILWWGRSYHIYNGIVTKISYAKWETSDYLESGIEEDFYSLMRYFTSTYGGCRRNGKSCFVLDHNTAIEAYMDTERETGVLRLHFYDLNSTENRFKFGNIW